MELVDNHQRIVYWQKRFAILAVCPQGIKEFNEDDLLHMLSRNKYKYFFLQFMGANNDTLDTDYKYSMLKLLAHIGKDFSLLAKKSNDVRLFQRIQWLDEVTIPWEELQSIWNRPQPIKFKFRSEPNWSHHHQNAFGAAILELHAQLHDENSPVLFIPAIEQFICDANNVPQQKWVGIIHSLVCNEDQFYVPDLKRLITTTKCR